MALFKKTICSVLFILLSTPLNAQQQADSLKVESELTHITSTLMSPFCPGRLLRDCPSSQAMELKEQIRKMLQNGQGEDQILTGLITQYGEQMRASPSTSGFGALAWIMPFAFLGLGLLAIVLWLRANREVEEEAPQ